jgi:hypothetical protein
MVPFRSVAIYSLAGAEAVKRNTGTPILIYATEINPSLIRDEL